MAYEIAAVDGAHRHAIFSIEPRSMRNAIKKRGMKSMRHYRRRRLHVADTISTFHGATAASRRASASHTLETGCRSAIATRYCRVQFYGQQVGHSSSQSFSILLSFYCFNSAGHRALPRQSKILTNIFFGKLHRLLMTCASAFQLFRSSLIRHAQASATPPPQSSSFPIITFHEMRYLLARQNFDFRRPRAQMPLDAGHCTQHAIHCDISSSPGASKLTGRRAGIEEDKRSPSSCQALLPASHQHTPARTSLA